MVWESEVIPSAGHEGKAKHMYKWGEGKKEEK
jgi:hypothetical protein